jgi:hypothetical protein
METLNDRETEHPILSWFIVGTMPEGEAPIEIKEQWLGVPLPVRMKAPRLDYRVGVLSGERITSVKDAIPVNTDDAILALRAAGKEEAADWWEANGHTHGDPTLLFDAAEGKLVRGNTLEDAQVAPFYGGVSPYL